MARAGCRARRLVCAPGGAGCLFAQGASGAAAAPTSWIARWQARATETQSQQPHWATPVATSTPRIDQAQRAEFSRQTNAAGYRAWNLGNSKGLELIPARRVELIFGVPPFFEHAQPGVKNGFGDTWFQGKYRFFARNEGNGNYAVLTAIVVATIPTGKDANGSCCAVVTPTLAGGKGWGGLALISTLGGSLPVTNAKGLGHTITWNNVAEYRMGTTGVARFFVPEMELNSSFYHGGANDGKTATYGTLGVVVGRLPLSHDAMGAPGRRALTVGAGEQIALTRYHPYNHAIIVSVRMPF